MRGCLSTAEGNAVASGAELAQQWQQVVVRASAHFVR